MVEIIGVRFNSSGKIYYFDPKGTQLQVGAKVLVETARGVEMGRVVAANKMVEDSEIVPPLKPILRPAGEADLRREEENREKEKEAFSIAVEKIAEHKLDMKLVGAEYTFDRSKLLFYFTADGRVDFRELVKTLAGLFRTRIELRQIGVRDEARQLGSLGICGRPLCCSTFLNDFHPVSIKMAKEQGLSLNPTKISGVCGRLMCCLQYEQNAYDDMLAKMPRKGETVETPDGPGIVVETATLKGQVKVKFTDAQGELAKMDTYDLEQLQFTGRHGGRNRRNQNQEKAPAGETVGETPGQEGQTAAPDEGGQGEARPSQKRNRRRKNRGGQSADGGQSQSSGEKPAAENQPPKPAEAAQTPGQEGPKKPRRRRPSRRRGGQQNKPADGPRQEGGGSPSSGGGSGGYSTGY